MGKKLQQIAENRRLKPKDVAVFFDVKPPSVYDWYEHGRISKKHYQKLEEFSGKPITWWLNMLDETATTSTPPLTAQEPRPVLQAVASKNDVWPFTLFSSSEWFSLDEKIRHEFENSIAGAIARARQTAANM